MKVVLIDTEMSGEFVGGAQLFLPVLLGGLLRRGHEVDLITRGEPNAKVRGKIEAIDVKVHRNLWDRASLIDDAAPVLAEWLNQLNPDVFLISVSPDIGWTVLPHLDANIATLTIGHNDNDTFYAPARYYRNFLTRAVGVSQEICERYVNDCGIDPDRVEWIPYGVETSEAGPQDNLGPLRLVYVGRFDETQKRISDVVRIAQLLSDADVGFQLDMVGDGDEMTMVRTRLSDEIERGRVTLHGWVESGEVLEIMRRADVFVLASAYEGFCISLIEAMANGCTPVVTDIRSGNKQLVRDSENGFIVPVGDIGAFVDRIKLLASDRERLMKMRRAAWETGREYGVKRMVDNYIECFERAIEDARANPRTPDANLELMPSCRSKYPLWLRRLKGKIVNRK